MRRRQRERRRGPLALGALGFVGGLMAGGLMWGGVIAGSRRDLFSRTPLRRLAALGYLAGRPGPETARLLSEFVAWEPHPLLRQHARRLLDHMAPHLD